MSDNKEQGNDQTGAADKNPDKSAQQGSGAQPNGDLAHPQHAVHSDNAKSKMPERQDEGRKESPADRPGKQPGEGEPPVG